ncbi:MULTISPECIES: hypothetical protein [unclassified Bradyrhizobium]
MADGLFAQIYFLVSTLRHNRSADMLLRQGPCLHTDADAVAGEHGGQSRTDDLRALIGVEVGMP